MSTARPESDLRWLLTAIALLVAVYFAVGAAAWCWDGAYNVLQGESPNHVFAVLLAVVGVLPVVAAGVYCVSLRRSGQTRRSSLAFASLVAIIASVFVLAFRASVGAGF